MPVLSRRAWLRRTLGSVVAAQLAAAGFRLPAPLTFTPRYYSVSVTLDIDEINGVTQDQLAPLIAAQYEQTASSMRDYMRARGVA